MRAVHSRVGEICLQHSDCEPGAFCNKAYCTACALAEQFTRNDHPCAAANEPEDVHYHTEPELQKPRWRRFVTHLT